MKQNEFQKRSRAVYKLAEKLYIRRQSLNGVDEVPEESAEIALELADSFVAVAAKQGYLFPEPLEFDDIEDL